MAEEYIPGQFRPKKTWSPMWVKIKATGEKACIKDYRFSAELHEELGAAPPKVEKEEVKEVVERPFACEQCDKTFKRAQDVKTHVKLKHSE